MTTNKPLNKYEEFVSNVLARNFNQKIDAESLRTAAEKMAEAVKLTQPKAAANRASDTDHAYRA
ncbi:hypothetical protein [Aminobacter carboxidus]|uniref:Uncharacterized protein n=1 Tax=Aminobacter carboxidus TaxID=376165 RepID=A0ABR9GV91_9HYPH|nr:hypothetical protein [Aminobacter carboxidus]MBE1207458.1 hypothetical protein [Aminobacter carboxidus]